MLFADLPEDILRLVFTTHFARDMRTLALLAALSRRLNRITTPILYSHVTLGLDDVDESRKVRRFIMSVFSSPHLAQCVRSLELNTLYWISRPSLSRRREALIARMMAGNILGRPDRLDMFRLITVVRRLPLLDKHKAHWCSELQEFDPSLDSLIALLFVVLPSIEHLECPWSSDASFIWHMLPRTDKRKVDPSPLPLVLRNLTHLKVHSQSPCGNTSEILPFFQMPLLTHFFGSNWGPIRRDGWDGGVEDGVGDLGGDGATASAITHLELRHCKTDLYSLQTIFKQCRSVRTFIFHRDWDPRVHVRLPADSITNALDSLRGTLENITLTFEPGIYIHHEGEIYPLNFSKFSSLLKLHIAAGYIVHDPDDFEIPDSKMYGPESEIDPLHTRLPESLEVLHITGFSTPQQMRLLIEDCHRLLKLRSHFPRLRELHIEAPLDDSYATLGMKALQHEARRADVLLREINNAEMYLDDEDDLLTPSGCDWGMNGEFKWSTKIF
ncbi:hypothetical protein BDW59DRAFT_5960 [Aspergillus cavernicola]|uniref:F-box domain-containing protein n=1 Tax=Aspergillus cavernicola TaxID=176166 RepID=A0ABR4J653_9EURO